MDGNSDAVEARGVAIYEGFNRCREEVRRGGVYTRTAGTTIHAGGSNLQCISFVEALVLSKQLHPGLE